MGERTADLVAAERAAQGLPPKVQNPLAYRDLAVLLRPTSSTPVGLRPPAGVVPYAADTSPRAGDGDQSSDAPVRGGRRIGGDLSAA